MSIFKGAATAIATPFSADGKINYKVFDQLIQYSGNDDQIVPILSLGGSGVISVLSNIAPRQTHDICQLYFKGKAVDNY